MGFPGESERDFEDTLDVMDKVRFAKVHMFPYSVRKRTRAALYPNKVTLEVIQERKQRLLRLAEQHAFELRQTYVGKKRSVLLENDQGAQSGIICGHTDNFLSVCIESKELKANDLIEVEFIANQPDSLLGKILS